MEIIKKNYLIIAILLLGTFLRLYKLDTFPALNADEAAIGYNAFSLIETGKDEHGNPWPIHFQSFNDYKPGLYFYLVIPFIKLLGLTEMAVRLPNVILSVLTIFIAYLITRQIFLDKKNIANFTALFIAISPWHIHFSRGGWEVSSSTFFISLGVLLFLKSLKTHSTRIIITTVIAFVLSLYTYHAARVVTPLIFISLSAIYWKDLGLNKYLKIYIFSGLLGIALLLPLIKDLTKGGVASRATGVGIFADLGPFSRINEQRGEHLNAHSPVVRYYHNKVVNYGLAFLENWVSHYHGEFLFLTGDVIERNRVPETGQMYLFDILLLALGIIYIIKNHSLRSKGTIFILLWIVLAPLAAALTFQSPHALRSQNMVLPLIILASVGASYFIELVQKLSSKSHRKLFFYLFAAFVAWNFGRYMHMYWTHMSKEYPFSSQYGVKELVKYVGEKQKEYAQVLITDRYDQPYILFLFYLKYPPVEFQAKHSLSSRDNYGFSTVKSFDKYVFESIDFDTAKTSYPKSLIIGTTDEIPRATNIIKNIYGKNNYLYFSVVAN